jgi:hypothetical protein
MRAIWQRRLLSATVTMLLAAIAALLGVEGYALFLAIALIVPVTMKRHWRVASVVVGVALVAGTLLAGIVLAADSVRTPYLVSSGEASLHGGAPGGPGSSSRNTKLRPRVIDPFTV